MTRVVRTNEEQILTDHEQRIARLERAPMHQIYIDDRVIASPVEVVTFDGFPSDREILELTWEITTDADDVWIYLAFNGDYPVTENDYRWRLFGDVAAAEIDLGSFNFGGAVGGSAILGEPVFGPNWGRARFIDFDEQTGAHGIIWQGDGGIYDGNSPHTWLISGCGDPPTPLTEIAVFAALSSSAAPDATQIVAPSRLTLTCY